MVDLNERTNRREVMDDLQAGGPDLYQALRELDAINYVLGGNYVTLDGIEQLFHKQEITRELQIADVGCGSGDMLKRVRRLVVKRKMDARLMGFDANPNVIKFARDHTPASCRIDYETLNIFSDEFKERTFDVVMGTLFFHHFTDGELIAFFKSLKGQVKVGLVINDIHRHWFSYYSIKWLTRIFSRSQMVKHDAAVSVLRAFKRRDLVDILQRSGFARFRIKWCWAFRWQVIVWF